MEKRLVSLVYIGFDRLIFQIFSDEPLGEEIKGIFNKWEQVVAVLFTRDDVASGGNNRYLNIYFDRTPKELEQDGEEENEDNFD